MKATGIRYNNKNGSGKPTQRILEKLCTQIEWATQRVGFITNAYLISNDAIKIGLPMRSFRINIKQLGHNARLGVFIKSPKGYKRTDVPTWDQRVEFNDIVNYVFDQFHLQANIRSGNFTIRTKTMGAYNEAQWRIQCGTSTPDAQCNGMDQTISHLMTEAEAREYCDSDTLEEQHKLNQRTKSRQPKLKLVEVA